MVALETRSFEARFGPRCPFCGRSWGDPTRCDPNPKGITIRDGLRLLFADRTANCVVCDRAIPEGRKRCFDCAKSVKEFRSKQDRHRKVVKHCLACGKQFTVRSDKRHQQQCGTCSRRRGRKRFCKRGHDTFVVGRRPQGDCRQCAREAQRKAA